MGRTKPGRLKPWLWITTIKEPNMASNIVSLNDHVKWDGGNPKFNIGYIRGISPDGSQVLIAGWRNPVKVSELSIAPEPHPPLYPPYTVNQWTI